MSSKQRAPTPPRRPEASPPAGVADAAAETSPSRTSPRARAPSGAEDRVQAQASSLPPVGYDGSSDTYFAPDLAFDTRSASDTHLAPDPTLAERAQGSSDTQFAPSLALCISDPSQVDSLGATALPTPSIEPELAGGDKYAHASFSTLGPAQHPMVSEPDLAQSATIVATDSGPRVAEVTGFAQGSQIGRFVVLRELGRGAMGIVLAGYDPKLDRQVAIKLVHIGHSRNPSLGRNLLLREAQALAKLSHPNVVGVHEVRVWQKNSVYVAMEYVQGVDLQQWLQAKQRHWREVIEVFVQAGTGLLAAHQRGLVHRDFKPANVLVGDDERVRVADFGLAAKRGAKRELVVTDTHSALEATIASGGALIGTPAYMAPELLDETPATALSDQFAFCVALYEALHGVRPFRGATIPALMHELRTTEVAAARPNPDVPAWLHTIVCRGLTKDPTRRYRTLEELLVALQTDPDAERSRRNRLGALVALAVVTTVILVVAITTGYRSYLSYRAEQEAQARLTILRNQLDALADDRDAATRVFETFVALPENRRSGTLSRAYLSWAEYLDDPAAEKDAYASAYINARRDTDAVAALRGLTLRLAQRGALTEAETALVALRRRAPQQVNDPELAAVALATALNRRDFATALDIVDHAPQLAAHKPLLQHLSRANILTPADLGSGGKNKKLWRTAIGSFDAEPGLELLVSRPDDPRVTVLAIGPELRRKRTLTAPFPIHSIAPIPFELSGAPTLLASTYQAEVVALAAEETGELRELARWPGCAGFRHLATDIDHDGQQEMYLGLGCNVRHLYRVEREAETWQLRIAHPPTDQTQSGVRSFVATDLDSDGHRELAFPADAWLAYDLRITRASGPNNLELVTRRSFGVVDHLSELKTPGDSMLVFSKSDILLGSGRFSPQTPYGEPAGLYVVDLVGGEIQIIDHTPIIQSDHHPEEIHTADLDGDGTDEVLVSTENELLIYRWELNKLQPPLVLPKLYVHTTIDINGDKRPELVLSDNNDRVPLFIVGIGDANIPVTPPPTHTSQEVPPLDLDPSLRSLWAQAEHAVAIGLVRRSANELAALARLAETAGYDLFYRAGELMAEAGEFQAAADYFLAAAEADPTRAGIALHAAGSNLRALGNFSQAQEHVVHALGSQGLGPQERAAAETDLRQLQRLLAPRNAITLDFAKPLDPRLHILDPLSLVRTDAGVTEWRTGAKTVATLPLTWPGGPVVVEAEFENGNLDWGVHFRLRLQTAPDDEWRIVEFNSLGSSANPQQQVRVVHAGPAPMIEQSIDDGDRIRVRIEIYPSEDLERHTANIAGKQFHQRLQPSVLRQLQPGPLELAVTTSTLDPSLFGHVRLKRIHLEGFDLRAGDVSPDASIARDLSDGNYADVLAALPTTEVTDPRHLWRIEALAGLGRLDLAEAAIAEVVALDDREYAVDKALFQRLRRAPEALLIAARKPMGWRLVDLIGGHLGFPLDPSSSKLVRGHLGDLIAADPPVEKTPLRVAWAHFLMGEAELLHGRPQRAEHWFAACQRLLDQVSDTSPELERLAKRNRDSRLTVALTRNDPNSAQEHALSILRKHPAPDIRLEMLHNDPKLQQLFSPDDWSQLERAVDAEHPSTAPK